MPHFQAAATPLAALNEWVRANREKVLGANVEAVGRA
jgi:hypothetical protein